VEELRQEALLLLGRAVAADLIYAEVCLHAVREADRRGRAAELLDDEHLREIAEPGAAELGLERDAEEAELAELGPQVARERVLGVDLRGPGRDALGREAPDVLAQHREVLVEAEIEVEIDHHGSASRASRCAITAARKRVASPPVTAR